MKFTTLRSINDFQEELEKIRRDYCNITLAYRGQKKDYDFVPSMYRGKGNYPAKGCIPPLTANWIISAKRLFYQVSGKMPTNREIQGIMQHYGYRSFFVDISYSPEIGLWFCLHQYESNTSPFYVDERLRSAVFQWSKYSLIKEGYFYIIGISKEDQHRHYNLMNNFPKNALRIRNQNAGSLYCNEDNTSANDLIIIKYKIINDGWYDENSLNYPLFSIFPPPSLDYFYKQLCSMPYYTSRDGGISENLGHPLLGFLPIYANTLEDISREFLPLTKLFTYSNPMKTWKIATIVRDFHDKRYKISGGLRYIVSSLLINQLSREIIEDETIDFSIWGTNNIIIEFEPEAFLVDFFDEKSEIVIGIWVLISENELKIYKIVDNMDTVKILNEKLFKKEDFKFTNMIDMDEEEFFELNVFLVTTYLLHMGKLSIEKNEDKSYLIYNDI